MFARQFALFIVTAPLLLAGCAGIGVWDSSDPLRKLEDARHLYWEQGRTLIAERLTWEAMEIYRERRDFYGLGHAHRQYASFLDGHPITQLEKFYREQGFWDKTVTYDNRRSKATEYYTMAMEFYRRAEPVLKEQNAYDKLSNLYLNMSTISYFSLKSDEHCDFLSKTIAAYRENISRNPGVKVRLPSEYGSFEEYIRDTEMAKACQHIE